VDLAAGASSGWRRQGRNETQPGILAALGELVQSSIRGDPEAPLLWVSKSQRHLSAALAQQGFIAGQKLVGRLLRRLGFSLQANAKTREGSSHPDRDAQRSVSTTLRQPSSAFRLVLGFDGEAFGSCGVLVVES